jgi:hypothetical protein
MRRSLEPFLKQFNVSSLGEDEDIHVGFAVASALFFVKAELAESKMIPRMERLIRYGKQALFGALEEWSIPERNQEFWTCFLPLQQGKGMVFQQSEDHLGYRLESWSTNAGGAVLKFRRTKTPRDLLCKTLDWGELRDLAGIGILFQKPTPSNEYLYGCTYGCDDTFEDLDEWKSHQVHHIKAMPKQWRCNERDEKGQECAQLFGADQTPKEHLMGCHNIRDDAIIRTKIQAQAIGHRGYGQIWCGWCRTLWRLKAKGPSAWNEAILHFKEHLDEGEINLTWIPPDGHCPYFLSQKPEAQEEEKTEEEEEEEE